MTIPLDVGTTRPPCNCDGECRKERGLPLFPAEAVCRAASRGPARDHLYEEEWLKHVVAEAERRHGVPAEAFAGIVRKRMAHGATLYGDASFLREDVDVIAAGLEETPDVAAYALMESQKESRRSLDSDAEKMHHLFEAAVAAALADWHFRLARAGS